MTNDKNANYERRRDYETIDYSIDYPCNNSFILRHWIDFEFGWSYYRCCVEVYFQPAWSNCFDHSCCLPLEEKSEVGTWKIILSAVSITDSKRQSLAQIDSLMQVKYGSPFESTNLRRMMRFAERFINYDIVATLSPQLS